MGKSNNVLLVLTIVLLFVSMFGAVTMLNAMNFEIGPARGAAIETGKVSLEIIPMEKAYDSTTGYVTLTILPEPEE